jgi:hypothetical protein
MFSVRNIFQAFGGGKIGRQGNFSVKVGPRTLDLGQGLVKKAR